MRRVPPQFSRPPEALNEVVLGANLSLTCVAVGSPMPFVKWRKGTFDITAEDQIPVGRNILELTNIVNSANYTCIAASTLGQIEAIAVVKVQCKHSYPPQNCPMVKLYMHVKTRPNRDLINFVAILLNFMAI